MNNGFDDISNRGGYWIVARDGSKVDREENKAKEVKKLTIALILALIVTLLTGPVVWWLLDYYLGW